MKHFAPVALMLALLATAAAAATLSVDATRGSFRTIQSAIDAASCGDVVEVRAGTYRERVTVGHTCTAAAPLLIRGDPEHRPVLTTADAPGTESWRSLDRGVYTRGVPADPSFDESFLPMDQWNPGMVWERGEPMRHATRESEGAPPVGRWSYDATTHEIRVHPRTSIAEVTVPRWAVNYRVLPRARWVRLQHFVLREPRMKNAYVGGPRATTEDIQFIDVDMIGAPRFTLHALGAVRLLVEKFTWAQGCRGMSVPGHGCFGLREFESDGLVLRDGVIRGFGTGAHMPGWTSADTAHMTAYASPINPKYTDGALIERVVIEDFGEQGGIGIDRSLRVTVRSCVIRNGGHGITIGAFQPLPPKPRFTGSGEVVLEDNVLHVRDVGIRVEDAQQRGTAWWVRGRRNAITAHTSYRLPSPRPESIDVAAEGPRDATSRP